MLFCIIFKNKKIFIAALDWGLGHATRCVPIIKQLIIDNEVIIGITPTTAIIFNDEFPELKKIHIEPYNIRYSNKVSLKLKLVLDANRILKVIKKEHLQLKHIINKYNIDVVISDNRFGLYSKKTETIYITHQLQIQAGWASWGANKIHHHYIKKFNWVWVPDFEDETKSLAGKLSRRGTLKNVTYINPQSRITNPTRFYLKSDILFLLSGPEPQRTILENEILKYANTTKKEFYIVRGTAQKITPNTINTSRIIDMATAEQLADLLHGTQTVVLRSGYSSLMDMNLCNKKHLILIPTPGQDEQVYLANYWKEKMEAKVICLSEIKKLF